MLVAGQIDEPVSIAGGCICCLPDDGGIDDALAKLADPRLNLDAVIVEASGLADPLIVSRIVGFSKASGLRYGGLVDIVDATTHFDIVDTGEVLPARYRAASLVVVNKLDRLDDPAAMVERVKQRVRKQNSRASVVGAVGGQIDPRMLFDVAGADEEPGQLSLRELLVEETVTADDHDHVHADSVTVTSDGQVDPGALIDLLEDPPDGVYRLKGVVRTRYGRGVATLAVNLVGPTIHIADAPRATASTFLVAIGMNLDTDDVRARLEAALRPSAGPPTPADVHRLRRYRRHSL